MKFNMEFFKGNTEPEEKEELQDIKKYIEENDNIKSYETEFPENITDKEMYHLSTQSQNIINWYPLKKEMKVLEVGGNLGELTGVLCEKCQEVVTIEPDIEKARLLAKRHETQENLEVVVGNFEDISLENNKFDIITLIGVIPKIKQLMNRNYTLIECIQYLEQYLTEDGRFLIAVDNKFGLRYFAGNPENIFNQKFESLIGYSNRQEKVETFTKTTLEKQLQAKGYKANFYYPLPDYRLANVIFTDKELPRYNSVDKYNSYYTEKSDTIINEIDVFREILKTDEQMFPFFANSFFVEVSRKEIKQLYKYISFNNMRKQEYRLITKIANDYVEKQVVSKEANSHYEQVKQNMKILEGNKIKTVDYVENGVIRSKYIDQKYLLNNILTQNLEKGDIEGFDNIIQQYIEILKIGSYQIEKDQKTVFEKYGIDVSKEQLEEMHFVKNGLWDMTFKNCFYMKEEFYFFDQEWNEENIPIEFILYRSILYTISLRRYVNIDDLFKKYGLAKYRELFEKLDNVLQEKIRDDRLWRFYSRNTYFDIDGTKQELINLGLRDNAKQLAIENLQREKENMQQENQKLQQENQKLQETIQQATQERKVMEQQMQQLYELANESICKKIYRKMKKILGGNHEQKN